MSEVRKANSERLTQVANRLAALPEAKQREFAAWLAQQGVDVLRLPIVATPRPERVPLSYAQRRLWLIDRLEGEGALYNVPRVLAMHGELDPSSVAGALTALCERHEALRTRFPEVDGEPVQQILAPAPFPLGHVDVSGLPEAERRARAQELARAHAVAPFDLAEGPLFRAELVRLSANEHWLLLNMHHIITDEWSDGLIASELVELYDATRKGRRPRLAPLAIQYADFALWQRRWLRGDALETELGYWKRELGTGEYSLDLPKDFPERASPSYAGSSHHFTWSPELQARLSTFSRERGATLFMTVLAAYHVLLCHYSGQREIRVGTPIAQRNRPEIEGLIGFFSNTQVLRSTVDGRLRFTEYLEQVRQRVAGAQSHQDLPFERLVEALSPERRLAHTPLFQVMFSWHRQDTDEQNAVHGLRIDQESIDDPVAKFDLTLHMTDTRSGLVGQFIYRSELFRPETIQGMATRLGVLVESLLAQPERRIAELRWIEDAEASEGLAARTATGARFEPRSIHGWIQSHAERDPDGLAVRGEREALTHAELEQRANRLAGALWKRGVRPEQRVGLCLMRSTDLIVGLYAVLKCGAAYVPLEPKQPVARLADLAADARLALVLGHPATRATAPELGVPCLWVDDDAVARGPAVPFGVEVTPEHAAYVIYTSGSTGKPKGVVVTHGNLHNYTRGVLARFELAGDVGMAMLSSVAADLGNTVLFGALCSGAPLHVLSEERAFDADALGDYFEQHDVGVVKITPSHLKGLLQAARPERVLPRHTLILGGETASSELLARIAELGRCRVFNHYGPTETTVGVLTYSSRGQEPATLPLGKPLPNSRVYVLDADLSPLPPGIPGEIFIGGAGVARGYLARPDLTADRFIPDRFGSDPSSSGSRLYRTGDRGKVLPDGNIQFLGRADDQVKLRGYRIELGEVRAELLRLDGIADAQLLVQPSQTGPRLVAYLIASGAAPDADALRSELERRLPEYMVPSDFAWLEQFPLLSNGKLDRKALPEPGAPSVQVAAAPRTPLERELLRIWQEVLNRTEIGIFDNFFKVGGDSLLGFQVIALARKAKVKISPAQLFEHQTIAALATVAEDSEASIQAAAPSEVVSGSVPLTAIQRWFFERQRVDRHHYNQALLLESRESIDLGALERSLSRLVERHPALGLRYFERADGSIEQAFSTGPERGPWALDIDLRGAADTEGALRDVVNAAQQSLSLSEGPLLQARCIDLGARGQRLLLVIHHLVVDGVSWRVLLEDLESLYRAELAGSVAVLLEPTTSFHEWARLVERYAESPELRAELDQWQALLGEPEPSLPAHDPAAPNPVGSARSLSLELDERETQLLLAVCPSAYRTQIQDLLASALAHGLCDWAGRRSVLIQVEGHGREPLFDGVDVSRTVGWFTSLYPVRLTPDRDDLGRSILGIKEQLRRIPRRGVGYGILRYLSGMGPELARYPAPQFSFNYLGQFDQTFPETAVFRPATESVGDERSPAGTRDRWFDVTALVYERKLQVSWQYGAELHRAEDVRALAERCLAELRRLIAHASDPRHAGVSPADFPLARLGRVELERLPVAAREIETIYPLTPMQQGILFHHVLATDGGDEVRTADELSVESSPYLSQVAIELRRAVDVMALERAWQRAVDAHPSLRTSYVWDGVETAHQIVHERARLEVERIDLTACVDPRAAADEFLAADRARGLDLKRAPVLRVSLCALAHERSLLVWTYHHIGLDGWSAWRVLAEVFQHYEAALRGSEASLAPTRPYADYVAWLARQDHAAAMSFWRGELEGLTAPTALVSRLVRGGGTGYARVSTRLDRKLSGRLAAFGRKQGLTLNTLVQGALGLLLGAYTGESEVVLGVTVSGRNAALPDVDRMVGLFINTLPLRLRLEPHRSLVEWLAAVQTQNARLREYEYAPLLDIQRASGLGQGRSPFDTLLVFENYPVDQALAGTSEALGIGEVSAQGDTSYPLTFEVAPGSEISIQLDHDGALVSDASARALLRQLEGLLARFAAEPELELAELSLAGPEERTALVAAAAGQQVLGADPVAVGGLARGELACGRALCLHELFEVAAARTPERPALVQGGRRLSYAELDALSERWAIELIERGVKSEELVGVAAEHSFEAVVAMLAILRAGAAYLPIDPELPSERLEYLLADAKPRVVLSEASVARRLGSGPSEVVVLQLDPLESRRAASRHAGLAGRRQQAHPDQLAYCIYTSGSTGRPKGTLVQHRSVINHSAWMRRTLGIGEDDRILQHTTPSFDAAVCEFWVPLLCGASVVLPPREALGDAALLLDVVGRERITFFQAVPSLLRGLIGLPGGKERLRSVRHLISGGEALAPELLGELAEGRSTPVYNLYGPTEATVDATYRACVPEDALRSNVPIGVAIDNASAFVLDRNLNLLPEGAPGDLYVAGAGLARGYFARPGLTAERFVPHPFASAAGERLYRTGDVVRRLPDRSLEYLGRSDRQIKLRGLRIELGEIEVRLAELRAVSCATVQVRRDTGTPRLVAYVVPADAGALGDVARRAQLRATLEGELARALPAYMLPQSWVFLAALPLTRSGKLDPNALPAPTLERADTEGALPSSELERRLAGVWAEVLHVADVGPHDNFFNLGGDSIVALQLVSKAKGQGIRISPRDLFQHQTVAALAHVAAQRHAERFDAGPTTGEVALSPIQRWFFENQKLPAAQHYNQAVLLEVLEPLDLGRLERALEALVVHHDGLRLRFSEGASSWQQTYAEAGAPVPAEADAESALLWRRHLTAASDLAAAITITANEAQQSLDLSRGPLLRAVHMTTGRGTDRLLLVVHHLIVDGVSWRVLLEDLRVTYAALAHTSQVELPAKTSSFKRWTMALAEYAKSASLHQELPYWQRAVGNATGSAAGKGGERGFGSVRSSRSTGFELEPGETEQLRGPVLEATRASLEEVLLTALTLAYSAWSKRPSLLIELEGHGREDVFDGLDLTRSVGWFTSLYPVRLEVDTDPSAALARVKQALREVPRKGIGYGVLRYMTEYGPSLIPEEPPQLTFNYLGRLDGVLEGDGLLRPAAESVGSEHSPLGERPSRFEVNVLEQRGRLEVHWEYGSEHDDEGEVAALCANFARELRALMARALGRGSFEVSSSDFKHVHLADSDLSELFEDM